MTFLEACQSARQGNFVSHHSFDYIQSMHEYNYNLYYEDGGNLTLYINHIQKQKWSNEGWYIKYTKEQVNQDKLKELHKEFKGKMLPQDRSFEECIVK